MNELERYQQEQSLYLWTNEIFLKAQKGLLKEWVLISDIDDTLLESSKAWYRKLCNHIIKEQIPPSFELFTSLGYRKTFENKVHDFNGLKDSLMHDPVFHRNFELKIDPLFFTFFEKYIGILGGYLTSRPPIIKEATEENIIDLGFPELPVLYRDPQMWSIHQTIEFKTQAVLELKKRLDQGSLKGTKILILDDYDSFLQKINTIDPNRILGLNPENFKFSN